MKKAADVVGRNRLARDIAPDDVLGVLRPIYERGKRAMADHVRSYIRSAYSWGHQIGTRLSHAFAAAIQIIINPADGIPTEPKVVGTRWLNEDEFVRLYRWLESPDSPVHPPYTRAVRVLMLTGQRVEEIASLHIDQWDARGADHRLVEDQERQASRDPCSEQRRRTYRVDYSQRIRLVLPVRKGPVETGQCRHAVQFHVAAARPRCYSCCDES